MRYLKQRDEFRCGPIAIINAMKWLKMKASAHSYLKQICEECNTDREGTAPVRFGKILPKYIRAHYVEEPVLIALDNYLNMGRAFILGYSYARDDGVIEEHYTLCIGKDSEGYIMVNDVHTGSGKIIETTVSRKSRNQLKEMVYFKYNGGPKDAWTEAFLI